MRLLTLAWLVAASAALVVAQGSRLAGPGRDLPEEAPFFDAVRQNVARANREQNRYAYKERRTDFHANPFGRIGTGGTRVFEVTPMPDGTAAMRRLIELDDKPTPGTMPERINLAPRRNAGGSSSVDDVVRTLEFTISRREMVSGSPFVVVDFVPRPNAKPTTRQGRWAKAFKGSMWINEAALEVERVEATAIDDISFGLGLVARIRKGAVVSAERKPVEGGIWLLTSLRFNGEGRAMVFRKLNVDYAIDWFDYRLVNTAR